LAKRLHGLRPGYARLGLAIDKAESDARTRIDNIKAKLTAGSNRHSYPQRQQAGQFAYYLDNVSVHWLPLAAGDEPQPQAGDMVLGGKGEQTGD